MSIPEQELLEQITKGADKLLQPPSSVDQLILLLEQIEFSLSKVEQSPPESIHNALSPLTKALVANDLLKHPDPDVKVAVASCISEITRITAPEAPYADDIMKDVFQLIVSSFENLHDHSSRSYAKRVLILETVSKVRSCVVMLDLECDGLIIDMFQHFLKAIREYHQENVFSSMASIMILVLEESEEVSVKLLTPLLASVKKDNKEKPIAKKLGKEVFTKCATKLKPYLAQAVESLHISLDEYDKIVTSVLEGTVPDVDHVNDNAPKDLLAAESKLADVPEAAQATQVDGSKLATTSLDEAGQMSESVKEDAESVKEPAFSEDTDPAVDRSPKSITSNGVTLEHVESAAEMEGSMKAEDNAGADLPDAEQIPSKSESADSEVGKPLKFESKLDQTSKKGGRRTNSSINSAESSHQASDDSEKKAEELPEHEETQNKDDQSSASEDPAVEQSNSLEKEPETTLQDSAPKEPEEEAVDVAPSPDQSLRDVSAPKKGRPKKKSSNKKASLSKKGREGTSSLEIKKARSPPLEPSPQENECGSTSDTEAKKQKPLGKKISDTKKKGQGGPSMRNNEDGKKRGRGKASLETLPSQESPDESAEHEANEEETPKTSAKRKRSSGKDKEIVPSPESPDNSAKDDEGNEEETPKTSAKRRRSSGKDKVSETLQPDGRLLVGSRVRVWWPLDNAFYEGVVRSFDSATKKHKVLYVDGDKEELNLVEERWELVENDQMSEVEEQAASADAATEKRTKKKQRNAGPSAKHEKVESSPKSKSKDTATKSGQKSKDDSKLKDDTQKSGGRTEDTSSNKSRARTKKSSGKSVDDTEKPPTRSKDVGTGTPKSTSKQEPVKAAIKPNNKAPQSGGKPSANGMEKLKASTSKGKESGNKKEKASISAKTPDSIKERVSTASKERDSEPKSGKKRGRGKS